MPEGYYKRVGYQKSEAPSSNSRVDALGQRVRDRFNEEVSETVSNVRGSGTGGLHHRTLKQLKSAHNKHGGPASQISRGSDVFSQNKRRSMAGGAAAAMSRHNLDVASAKIRVPDDVQSVITLDRLKKFNDIQGTTAGNVLDEIAAKEQAYDNGEGDFERDEEGQAAAEDAAELEALREEERDEVMSQQMAVASCVSKRSGRSNATSKTYISKLEKQLEVERVARLKLEQEVEEMKKINAEISSKLGLSTPSMNNK